MGVFGKLLGEIATLIAVFGALLGGWVLGERGLLGCRNGLGLRFEAQAVHLHKF